MPFLRDLRFAIRSLARVPALWITVALTLALGIGANAAIFSIVRDVLLRPLVNRDEARLLYVRQSAPGIQEENAAFSVPEIDDLGKNLNTVSEVGTISPVTFTVVGLGTPREVPSGVVDGHYFEVMGLRPVLGRLISPADDGPNAAGAIVLTYRFWTSSLKSDPKVLGKNVRLESYEGARTATIVGVVEPSVPYPVETEIIGNIVTSPHHLSATMVTGRTHRMTEVFARLAPTATLDQARAELRARYEGILVAHPEVYRPSDHFRIDVTRMHDQINSRANTVLWVLFAASGLLFAIACSNVANLVLARTVRRESELAVRSALGASTATLRRSLLAESLILCGSGVIAALLFAWPMVRIIGRYAARFSVRAEDVQLDFSLVGFGIGLAFVAAVFLAFIPRLPAGNALAAGLTSTRTTSGTSNRRLRLFAILQITASFLLLTGAAVLMRTLYTLEQTRPPFETSHVLAVNLPVMNYGRTPDQVRDFYDEVERRVGALPGVSHVATGFSVPWRDAQGLTIALSFAATGAPRANGIDDWRSKFRVISSGYFATLGIPIVEGRDFRESDKTGVERVVIISQSLAKTLYPKGDAVNQQIHWTDPVIKFVGLSPEPRRIVGVVADADDENIIPAPVLAVYQPATAQEAWFGRLLVRSQGDPYTLVPTISRTIHDISAEEPVEHPNTLEDIRAELLTSDKLNAIVFGGFAAVALLISIVGVAGVLAFSVSGRTREFGIRLALGAKPRNIMNDVLLQGATIAGIGLAAGLVFGIASMRGIAQYVADFHMPDLLTFTVSALVILAAAVIASAVPAARAARVNAVEALRSE